MSPSSLISIIVPVYKIKEEYLRACIASLLRQTYENFEAILVDDGSPDDCGRICDECAEADARIFVIHQANAGVSAARNAGLDRAHGEYIAFVDPDDYLEDAFLERMLAQMPQDAQIISCCAQVIGDDFTDTDHFFSGSRIFTDDAANVVTNDVINDVTDDVTDGVVDDSNGSADEAASVGDGLADEAAADGNDPADEAVADGDGSADETAADGNGPANEAAADGDGPTDETATDSDGTADEAEANAGAGGTFRRFPKKDLFLQLMDSGYGQPQKAYTAIGVPWGKIYRADFLRENGLRFDTGLPRMQDNLFNMYVFHAAGKIVYIDEPLYDYRYEHIKQFSAVKNRWYLDTFYAVSTARQRCMRSTGLIEDPELKKAYQEELLSLLLGISYKGIFHSANGCSPAKKKEEWLELLSRPLYQDLQGDFKPASGKRKLYLFAIQHRSFALMDAAMRRREWKEIVSKAPAEERLNKIKSAIGGGNAYIDVSVPAIMPMTFREGRACA